MPEDDEKESKKGNVSVSPAPAKIVFTTHAPTVDVGEATATAVSSLSNVSTAAAVAGHMVTAGATIEINNNITNIYIHAGGGDLNVQHDQSVNFTNNDIVQADRQL